MAKTCKRCPDGTWQCGEDQDLCNPAGGWQQLGDVEIEGTAYRVSLRDGAHGKVVKLEERTESAS